ncbi:histidinol phosphate phosphatase [Porphyromonas gingivalis]|uniref:HU family DNA-binding protein n=1 Tax=Porphyromonas gingivalis TaxID=837 RepID=UPI000974F80D|nr:histidinol phosphate phosphatase [Porphyromonas gingivalis]SJL24041.1 histone-like family DNA-binding protein [Porphyromonas gingivalis]
MANKPLQFVLMERKMNVGPQAGKIVQVAHPTGRRRVDFRCFCERVAKSTTFNRQEVEAVLNYATEIARDIVANGDIVEFGDLGTLSPSFKSKIVPQGEVFNVQKHIEKPVVRLSPSKKYFILTDVTYEQTVAKPKKGSKKPTPQPNEGGASNEDDGL